MARRPNYGFEKRSKELNKQRKREEKEEKKRARRDADAASPEAADEGELEAPGAVRAGAPARRTTGTTGTTRETRVTSSTAPPAPPAGVDPGLQARLAEVIRDGREMWARFDRTVRQDGFHPFVPADYDAVLRALAALHAPGLRFLEWGSATGVITILADLLGFEAYGIELDPRLVEAARALAARHGSAARFAAGSLFPTGYHYLPASGDPRTGTLGSGESAYARLGHPLHDFQVVYGYPWDGEEPVMHDVMRRHGAPGARLVVAGGTEGVRVFRGGRPE